MYIPQPRIRAKHVSDGNSMFTLLFFSLFSGLRHTLAGLSCSCVGYLFLPRTNTLSHTHTCTHSHVHTLAPALAFTISLSLSLSFSACLAFSLPCSHSLSFPPSSPHVLPLLPPRHARAVSVCVCVCLSLAPWIFNLNGACSHFLSLSLVCVRLLFSLLLLSPSLPGRVHVHVCV